MYFMTVICQNKTNNHRNAPCYSEEKCRSQKNVFEKNARSAQTMLHPLNESANWKTCSGQLELLLKETHAFAINSSK